MANITEISCERIANIRAFSQGININKVVSDSAKELLELEDACRNLVANEQEKRYRQDSMPTLAEPKVKLADIRLASQACQTGGSEESSASRAAGQQEPGFSANASLLGSMATLRKLLHAGNLEDLRNQLALITAEKTAIRLQGEKLLSIFEKSLTQLEEANKQLEESQQALKDANNHVNDLTEQQKSLQEQYEYANQQLSQTQDELAQARAKRAEIPEPPQTEDQQKSYQQLSEKINQLQKQLDTQQGNVQTLTEKQASLADKLTDAKQIVTQLDANVHKAAQAAIEKAQQADQHRSAINKLVDSAPRKVPIDGDNLENALALLTQLTAQLKKTLGEDAIKNMRRQQDVIEALNEASRKDQEKKANEADEAQRKAEAASKAAGCISKTLGIIMLVVSVVATVVTFGTAGPLMMAVAAIGLAMAVADVVLEANGCSTLMEMAANEIAKGVSSLLIQCGVAPEKAKQIANIVGMVVAAVAFLALSLLSVSSFVKNAGTAVAKTLQTGTKMAANVLKSAAKALSDKFINILMKIFSKTGKLTQQFTKFAKNTKEVIKLSDVTARRIEMGTKGANMVMGVTKSAVGGGLNLYASAQISDMKALLGALIKDNESIQAWVRALEALIKSWAKDFDQHSTDFDNMLTATNESGRTKANLMKSSYA